MYALVNIFALNKQTKVILNSKKSLFLVLFALQSVFALAQDFHFSQYWAAPIKLNPALTGLFDGQLRLGAIYRNQWIQQQAFATYAVSADANLFSKPLNGDVFGFGLSFYQEIEGKNAFKNTGANLSLAFNKKIGKRKLIHYLGLGFDFSYFQKQINLQNAVYGNLFESGANFDPVENYNYKSTSFADFGLGANYVLQINQKHMMSLGFAVSHILNPNISFSANDEDVLYRKFSLNVSGQIQVKRDFINLNPLLLLQTQGPHTELLMGTYLQFILSQKNNTSIYAGAQYRLAAYENKALGGDAIILSVRAEHKSFDFGVAYDFTTSALSKNNVLQGGPEAYLIYILKGKDQTNKQMSFCPKF